jgi:dTDP-4-dehydrorhamnose 3,5-epimerase
MKIIETRLPGVLLIEPDVFGDHRGFFLETWNRDRYMAAGFPDVSFVQDNHSCSCKGVLRGLHYQIHRPQGKLVQVTTGAVFDVVVDVRYGSPNFGQWAGYALTDENHHQLWAPPGFAHAFCVLSDVANFIYKCTDYYRPDDEGGVLWSDPCIGIDWPVQSPILSAKDQAFSVLADVAEEKLPIFPV